MKELIELQHAVQTVSKIKDIKLRTRKKEFILARALFSMVAHQNFKISKKRNRKVFKTLIMRQ